MTKVISKVGAKTRVPTVRPTSLIDASERNNVPRKNATKAPEKEVVPVKVSEVTITERTDPPPIVTGEHAHFAKALHAAMKNKGWNQSAVAAALWGTRDVIMKGKPYKVSKNRDRVSLYLRGLGFPRKDTLFKLASVLGVKPEHLAPRIAASSGAGYALPTAPATVTFFDPVEGRPAYAELRFNATLPVSAALEIMTILAENNHVIEEKQNA
jgi:transcriptional regulator with XRE-family HTH domain